MNTRTRYDPLIGKLPYNQQKHVNSNVNLRFFIIPAFYAVSSMFSAIHA